MHRGPFGTILHHTQPQILQAGTEREPRGRVGGTWVADATGGS